MKNRGIQNNRIGMGLPGACKGLLYSALLLFMLMVLPMQANAQNRPRDTIKTSKSNLEMIQEDRKALEKRIEQRKLREVKIEQMNQQVERDKQRVAGSSNWAVMNYEIVGGDTVFIGQLPAVFKFGTLKDARRSGRQWREYKRLVYNFRIVYPYALQARAYMLEADSVMAVSNFTEKEREEYLAAFQKRLLKQFEKPLRKLTISQGRLLLKLLDRELGKPSFYIIREYRGRFTAGFWQMIAKIFSNDLKRPYDKFGEDRAVEDLVLLWQSGSFDALYFSIFWR